MVAPHLGHFRSKQGVPVWWGTRSPQLGQTQSPPGPAAKPPDLPRPPPLCPIPLPVPGPCPLGPVPSPRGILLSSLFSVFRIFRVRRPVAGNEKEKRGRGRDRFRRGLSVIGPSPRGPVPSNPGISNTSFRSKLFSPTASLPAAPPGTRLKILPIRSAFCSTFRLLQISRHCDRFTHISLTAWIIPVLDRVIFHGKLPVCPLYLMNQPNP